ncbi:MAG TPA: histidine kinase [Actinomycetota bacterium]|nr:histidine kinase [Actinomycetota bacterium]
MTTAGLGIVMLLVVPRSDLVFTTFGGRSSVAWVADLAAGLGLLLAGLLTLTFPSGGSPVPSAVGLAGLAWLSTDWVGWDSGPSVVRSAAMVLEPFFLAIVFHVVVGSLHRRIHPQIVRVAVIVVYGVASIISVGRALMRDPFFDPYCWSNCRDNVFLITNQPGVARTLDVALILTSLILGLLLAGVSVRWMTSGTSAARRAWWTVSIPGILVGAAAVVHAVAVLRQRLEDPGDPSFSVLFQARAWSATALAIGVGWVLVRALRARTAIARLATDLGAAPPPGSLGLALGRATGDAGLLVAYPLPGTGRYVDAAGSAVDLSAARAGRVVTPIVRGGRESAVIVHDPAVVDAGQLRREIGAAARLAVDNERLQAELLAQLEDLRASRVRIVDAADAERRQLERNLHDGAQQRLLALSYDVRRGRVEAEAAGDEATVSVLRAGEEDVRRALAELRELAHGIYPAILSEAGIGPALWALAESASIPVEIGEVPDDRLPDAVERTAFVVASEAMDAAERTGSTHAEIRALRLDGRLVIEVRGAGPGSFVHIEDRVGAVGGVLTNDGKVLRAEIPCE